MERQAARRPGRPRLAAWAAGDQRPVVPGPGRNRLPGAPRHQSVRRRPRRGDPARGHHSGHVLAGISFIGRPAFRIILARISRVGSEELFLLCVLLIALGTAAAASLAGLSAPIGAFLAGMAIGESDFRHQVEAELRSLRDVLLGLFFITIGMQVNPSVLIEHPLAVFAWLLVFTLGKAAITMLVGRMMGWSREISLRVAIVLAHGGEFGLLLLSTATLSGLIDRQIGQPALLALIISMALAPVLIRNKTHLLQMLPSWVLRPGEATRAEPPPTLKDHVVICGYGRVGRLVVLAADAANLPYLCIENNGRRFAEAKDAGYCVLFGDASRPEILRAASIERARLAVVTFDRRPHVGGLLASIRQQNPAAAILVSADDARGTEELAKAGATAVFQEDLAAGLALADQTLLLAGFTQDEAADVIRRLRAELNPKLEAVVGI
nr:cation:proton antiporter [Rhodomicrobium sp. R_RK_3]